MTFYLIAGIISIILALILILVFVITRKFEQETLASKVIMWIGLLFCVTGISLLAVNFLIPDMADPPAPHVMTVSEHFFAIYQNEHRSLVEYDSITYESIHEGTTVDLEDEHHITYFYIELVYIKDDTNKSTDSLATYEYTTNYKYENIEVTLI